MLNEPVTAFAASVRCLAAGIAGTTKQYVEGKETKGKSRERQILVEVCRMSAEKTENFQD